MSESSCGFTSSSFGGVINLLDFGHSNRYMLLCYLTVVLISISLMACDVGHLFICSLAICVFSLVRWLLSFLALFKINVVVFLFLSFNISFHILYKLLTLKGSPKWHSGKVSSLQSTKSGKWLSCSTTTTLIFNLLIFKNKVEISSKIGYLSIYTLAHRMLYCVFKRLSHY